MKARTSILRAVTVLAILLGGVSPALLFAADKGQLAAQAEEDFFIVSSVDVKKKQIVLKRPTEVTELLMVTEKTVCESEQGEPLKFESLRAGDTVYVTSRRNPEGMRTAVRIRKGPMTIEELRRRYLPFH